MATTAATRIDENGDDIPADEVRERARKQYEQKWDDDEKTDTDKTAAAED